MGPENQITFRSTYTKGVYAMRPFLTLAVVAITCFVIVSVVSAALPPGYTGKPFSGDTLLGRPQQIPGVVKGVFVDSGGAGVTFNSCCAVQAYAGYDYDIIGAGTNGLNDSSVNATHPTSHLSYMVPGQWMKYTVHVNTAGTYYVDFKLATVGYPNLQILTYYNGTSVKKDSVVNLPVCQTPPGCPEPWHAWNYNMNVDSVSLDTGLQVFQITFQAGSWNYDWMRFRLKEGTAAQGPAVYRSHAGPTGLWTDLSGGRLTVSYNAGASAAAKISLVDCAGKTVLSSIDKAGAAGGRTASLDVRNLRHGVYFVNVERGGDREATSVTITR
jgi:hypothetical protein